MAPHAPPQVFLVDGYALIYRAFFAMISRPLRTSRGENTSAAWGVVNFLLRLRDKYRPDYVAWVHDAGTSFRTERFPDYKSTRQKLDAELQADFDRALEHVRTLLTAFGVPIIAVAGYEADDVIGTLARRYAREGLQAVIVSGDKDFYQLIGPRVALLNPGRGGPAGVEEHWVDEHNASERLGVPPAQVVDFLALVGDTSDNVPGVKGIGDKGAQKLLAEFGNLDAMLSRAGEVSGKRAREALETQAGNARLSRELVTIQDQVPVEVDREALRLGEPDAGLLLQALTDLEFHSLAKRLGLGEPVVGAVAESEGGGDGGSGGAPPPQITIVDDPGDLEALATHLRGGPVVALEAFAAPGEPRTAELIGLALTGEEGRVWYLPFGHRAADGELAAPERVPVLPSLTDPATAPIADLLRDPAVPKAGHDFKRDWQILRGAGVEVAGMSYDTMLASFVLEPGRRSHELETLALDHLGRQVRPQADILGRGKSAREPSRVPVPAAAAAAAARLDAVLALRVVFAPSLEGMALEPLFREVELPLVEVLVDMEWAGIAIDPAVFRRLARELADDLARLDAAIATAAGMGGGDGEPFNLNSPKQLAAVLFDALQLPVLKRTKTGPSTDAEVLEQLAAMGHEVPALLLEYRELEKLRSTYVDVLPGRVNPRTGRIHTSFNQTGAATGRLSSSEPNLQNIPIRTPRGEEVRKGFVPGTGALFVVADYSQIELRLMAHLSEDPAFIEAFRRGGDIHRETAAVIFAVATDLVTPDMRARAKTINFATIYGQGPFSLSRQLGISQEEAKAFIAEYFARFAGVRAYLDAQVERGRREGYVETLFKRRRYVPELHDRNWNVRAFGERLCQNSPLQGSAADLIKRAMIEIHRALQSERSGARLLLQVHDELVLEAPAAEAEAVARLVKERMEGAAELKVPLVVDVGTGDTWLDAKH